MCIYSLIVTLSVADVTFLNPALAPNEPTASPNLGIIGLQRFRRGNRRDRNDSSDELRRFDNSTPPPSLQLQIQNVGQEGYAQGGPE